jgi:hypothetical protein
MPSPTTLQDLITLVRQESNQENSQFVTDAELTSYINNSLAEMDDIMIDTYEDYRLEQYTSVIQSPNFTIPTPQEMLKLRGVDILGNGVASNGSLPWFPIPKFQFIDRGRLNNLTSALTYPFGNVNLSYFWQGAQGIIIYPQVQASGTYQIWWVPKFSELNLVTDVLAVQMDQQAWIEYAVVDCCIKIYGKDNLDTQTFERRKEALRVRIIGSMSNRDVAGPDCIVNMRNRSDYPGWGGSFGNW